MFTIKPKGCKKSLIVYKNPGKFEKLHICFQKAGKFVKRWKQVRDFGVLLSAFEVKQPDFALKHANISWNVSDFTHKTFTLL